MAAQQLSWILRRKKKRPGSRRRARRVVRGEGGEGEGLSNPVFLLFGQNPKISSAVRPSVKSRRQSPKPGNQLSAGWPLVVKAPGRPVGHRIVHWPIRRAGEKGKAPSRGAPGGEGTAIYPHFSAFYPIKRASPHFTVFPARVPKHAPTSTIALTFTYTSTAAAPTAAHRSSHSAVPLPRHLRLPLQSRTQRHNRRRPTAVRTPTASAPGHSFHFF